MTTKFFVQVEPSYYERGALRVHVNISKNGAHVFTTRRDGLTLGDDKDQHARLLANLQTCDPDPLIEVEDAHFKFCFSWQREPGQRLIRRCSQCQALVAPWLSFCPHCDEPLPQAGA